MISTGKIIFDLLCASTALHDLVGDNIFPLVAPEETKAPFVIYGREFIITQSKDRGNNGMATITISIVSNDYISGINIAEECLKALKNDCRLISGSEVYESDVYAQTLIFSYWGV